MSDFGETTSPVAAKEHQCSWCAGPIPKGEKHKQFKGIWEGEWQNWRMHDECYADSEEIRPDGFMLGEAEMPERVKALVKERRV